MLCCGDIYWGQHANQLAPGLKTSLSQRSKGPVQRVQNTKSLFNCVANWANKLTVATVINVNSSQRLNLSGDVLKSSSGGQLLNIASFNIKGQWQVKVNDTIITCMHCILLVDS